MARIIRVETAFGDVIEKEVSVFELVGSKGVAETIETDEDSARLRASALHLTIRKASDQTARSIFDKHGFIVGYL